MKQRLSSIQVIRAIAFILIFLSHVELISTGPIGVSLFLVLSGFCMTYAYLDRPEKISRPNFVNNAKFVWRKVKRLYSLHVVTLLVVSLAIFGGLILNKASGKEIAEQSAYFIANGLLLQSWIPRRDGYFSFNAVSWYLSTIAFSYFLFPYVFREIQSKDKKRIVRLAVMVIGLMILLAIILGIGQQKLDWTNAVIKWVVYICPLYRAGDFTIGLIAGYVFVMFKNSWGRVSHTAAEIVVIVLMAIQVMIYDSGTVYATNWSLTLFWLPTSVICIYLFAVNKGVLSRALTKNTLLVWIGNISGEAFLIHQICIKAAEFITKDKWLVAVISFSTTLICTVIWRWAEEKILKRYMLLHS